MAATVVRIVRVTNEKGLHLKPAQALVTLAGRFKCRIWLARDGQRIDAKSTLGLLALGAAQGTELELSAEGDDAEAAVAALASLFDGGLGEPDAVEGLGQ